MPGGASPLQQQADNWGGEAGRRRGGEYEPEPRRANRQRAKPTPQRQRMAGRRQDAAGAPRPVLGISHGSWGDAARVPAVSPPSSGADRGIRRGQGRNRTGVCVRTGRGRTGHPRYSCPPRAPLSRVRLARACRRGRLSRADVVPRGPARSDAAPHPESGIRLWGGVSPGVVSCPPRWVGIAAGVGARSRPVTCVPRCVALGGALAHVAGPHGRSRAARLAPGGASGTRRGPVLGLPPLVVS